MLPDGWFYIRSTGTGNVISASTSTDDLLRSQVLVTPSTLSDHELWCWKGQFLSNKANDLVLDIRKGRLRLIEDTEICLYKTKPLEEAHNQLWGVRQDAVDAYGRKLPGSYIYSLCSNEWVLDVQPACDNQKLVLFPLQPIDNDNQRWLFVPEGELDLTIPMTQVLASISTTISPSNSTTSYFSSNDTIITPPGSVSSSPSSNMVEADFPRGLTPAKRGSHSAIFSMETFKEYHQRVYTMNESCVSDKGIAMASAYQIFQNWKLDQISSDSMTGFPLSSSGEVRSRLQLLTQNEVSKLLSQSTNNNKENTTTLSSRLIAQLYDQTPISP
ncbi:uncharacterized protein EV154DRAFT_410905 [Mucor mucedo]|uniref:uncharacterized protein n=1 Tax=Mucor mucedo TaxID=29922 RepID=UPI00221E74AF|nr:uncharacterized protein EV154DRAFT_410905 [Mucor mucedo]KAI7896824.1 hypothetical protein EV154DRAFT_410905 [Mucor mucedo]